jgi:hypothetical protein
LANTEEVTDCDPFPQQVVSQREDEESHLSLDQKQHLRPPLVGCSENAELSVHAEMEIM